MRNHKRFDDRGYHAGDYDYPKTKQQMFEVITGAILTQNTSWKNVEKALEKLHEKGITSPDEIINTKNIELGHIIKPAGYYNQKTLRLKTIAQWFKENVKKIDKIETSLLREELLSVKGIGPETADSILLYAFKRPVFVVDAYTLRLFERLGLGKMNYSEAQETVHNTFKDLNTEDKVRTYNEFHALIVEHAKRHCRKTPVCEGCILKKFCSYAKER